MTFGDLPAMNACLNGASALFLGAGYVLIRQGRWRAHRGFMLAAFVTSTLFLLCYLATCLPMPCSTIRPRLSFLRISGSPPQAFLSTRCRTTGRELSTCKRLCVDTATGPDDRAGPDYFPRRCIAGSGPKSRADNNRARSR